MTQRAFGEAVLAPALNRYKHTLNIIAMQQQKSTHKILGSQVTTSHNYFEKSCGRTVKRAHQQFCASTCGFPKKSETGEEALVTAVTTKKNEL